MEDTFSDASDIAKVIRDRHAATAAAAGRVSSSLWSLSNYDHLYWRIVYNNSKFSLADAAREALAYVKRDSDIRIMIDQKPHVLRMLANHDALCAAVNNYFLTTDHSPTWKGMPFSTQCLMLDSSDFLEKILARTMMQKEYEGILLGRLPFSRYGGNEYFVKRD